MNNTTRQIAKPLFLKIKKLDLDTLNAIYESCFYRKKIGSTVDQKFDDYLLEVFTLELLLENIIPKLGKLAVKDFGSVTNLKLSKAECMALLNAILYFIISPDCNNLKMANLLPIQTELELFLHNYLNNLG